MSKKPEIVPDKNENGISLMLKSSICYNKYQGKEYRSFGENALFDRNVCCNFDYLIHFEESNKLNILIRKSLSQSAKASFDISIDTSGETSNRKFVKNDWIDEFYMLDLFKNFKPPRYGIHISINMLWHGFNDITYTGLTGFFSQSDFSDFTIMIGTEKIPVHKILLAAHSPVFLKMFTSDMKEAKSNKVTINDIDSKIFKYVLKFCYTNKAEGIDNIDNALQIMKVADKYKIDYLKNICEIELVKKINLDNVFEVLLISDEYNACQLKTSITNFMIENKKSIIAKNNFNSVALERPELFIDFFVKSINNTK